MNTRLLRFYAAAVIKFSRESIDNPYLIGYNIYEKRKRILMKRTFVELPIFRSRWEDLGLNDGDLRRLQIELLADPKVGAVMQGTGSVRKMRFAFEHRGKSGGVRVIYVDFEVYEKIYLLTAYTKNEKDNLTKEERNNLKRLIAVLEQQLKDNT